MKVFVTGATGYIGTAVVAELLTGGHEVVGLCRSDGGAEKLTKAGAQALRGSLEDLESLEIGAKNSDGVIHLGFIHDFANFDASLATDVKAVETMTKALKDTGKPFVSTAHAGGSASDEIVMESAKNGVRASIIALGRSVHGDGDKGFVPQLIQIARQKGFSAFVDNGANRWPAIHRLDAAKLFRLALESAPAGTYFPGTADEGVPFRDIAEMIGKKLNLPVQSIAKDDAQVHFGFLGALASYDMPEPSKKTRDILHWKPEHHSLLEDLESGSYFN